MGNVSGCCERSKTNPELPQKKEEKYSLLWTYSGDKKEEMKVQVNKAEDLAYEDSKNKETFDIIINEVEALSRQHSSLT